MRWILPRHAPRTRRATRRHSRIAALVLALAASLPRTDAGESPGSTNPPVRGFVRFETAAPERGHLDTAIRTYSRDDGVTVALIAAVHVADRAYYEQLRREFEDYDALLYEMIREGGASSEPGPDISHPVSQAQVGLKRLLGLEFQLECIDYRRSNFVHADLDPQTFQRLQEEQGESILGLMLRAALEEERRLHSDAASALGSYQIFWALLRADRIPRLKFLLGRQMDRLEETAAGLDRGRPTVLVSGRNEKVIQVLQDQVRKGRRTLGVFYGAGHMPDLERRLLQLGFELRGERWLTAWDVRPAD